MTPIQPPMTDERLDRLVRQLLAERADDVAAVALPAETMAAVVASHVRRRGTVDRRPLLLVTAALLLALVAGAVAVGSGVIRPAPSPDVAPLPVVVPSLDATSPSPSAAPPAASVLYTVFRGTSPRRRGLHESQRRSIRHLHQLADLGRRSRWRQQPPALSRRPRIGCPSSTCPAQATRWCTRDLRRLTASRARHRTWPTWT
jgi:hypothetical protein